MMVYVVLGLIILVVIGPKILGAVIEGATAKAIDAAKSKNGESWRIEPVGATAAAVAAAVDDLAGIDRVKTRVVQGKTLVEFRSSASDIDAIRAETLRRARAIDPECRLIPLWT